MNDKRTCRCRSAVVLILLAALPAAGGDDLSEHLAPLTPFIGKTWRGTVSEPGAGTESIDVSRWERALNGQAVRVLHSINDGEYGGESLIIWDKSKSSLVFYYFTTAGFYTNGSITIDGMEIIFHEYVTGNAEGVTEVKGHYRLMPDGTFVGRAERLKNGEWVRGHEVAYAEAPGAEVIFR